jgi:hypothetical protein
MFTKVQHWAITPSFVLHFKSWNSTFPCRHSLYRIALHNLESLSLSVALQVLDPSGRFLRAFGSQGTADGRFNYPWGITTDALGFIYVCDKENHRVQVTEEWSLVLIGSLMKF